MIEKGKISAFQIEFMIVPAIIATGILTIPSIAISLAGHDVWLTPILGSFIGFLTVFIAWKLHEYFPSQTPVEYSEIIVGKWIGKLLGVLFVIFYLHNTGFIVREYSAFITSNVMLHTPSLVFSVSILFISAIAVRGGIEVIARCAVICTTLYLITSLSLLLLLKDINISYMLPFLEDGIVPVLKGSFVQQAWFSEFFILAFLFPFMKSKDKGLKSGMKSTLYVLGMFFYVMFFVLTILGMSAMNQFYPVYTVVKAISIMGFFENFEVLITGSWVLGNFIKITVFLYIVCIGLAQLIKLPDYRALVFPVSLLILLLSYWDIPNIVELIQYMTSIQPFYLLLVQTIIPFILLIITVIRKRRMETR